MPGWLQLRRPGEKAGARRHRRSGSLAPSGLGLMAPGQLLGVVEGPDWVGQSTNTPERTSNAAGRHALQNLQTAGAS